MGRSGHPLAGHKPPVEKVVGGLFRRGTVRCHANEDMYTRPDALWSVVLTRSGGHVCDGAGTAWWQGSGEGAAARRGGATRGTPLTCACSRGAALDPSGAVECQLFPTGGAGLAPSAVGARRRRRARSRRPERRRTRDAATPPLPCTHAGDRLASAPLSCRRAAQATPYRLRAAARDLKGPSRAAAGSCVPPRPHSRRPGVVSRTAD